MAKVTLPQSGVYLATRRIVSGAKESPLQEPMHHRQVNLRALKKQPAARSASLTTASRRNAHTSAEYNKLQTTPGTRDVAIQEAEKRLKSDLS
ncbi:hypothetical protein NDU88_003236 [Pleurodeles waltl]|uniref:Uncharacterized protein n=1 Tax=Pleurodeles waltl TaxID=8319 RepID=A0AAV7MR70_PLEWA|nr:hypothetical protein NDU88_003236 [Pleurodeles waltl]